ncbi:hypothetical protein SAMN04487896_3183 [Paenibacillus sp. ov031]|uniref:hypothetical protein n=1 Tax=Paenibacillus sp. ov031 TaxID=1761879 RepID=UPI00091EEF46|nr:hypothetical protein [Paenibacillus sp. ov031]SHN73298.1 hypothetical protein SAMN04487896_3183 [Paenibacillus sp. ov031]
MYRKSNSFGAGLYNLSQASEPNELFEAWASMNTSDDTRAVLSLDNYHKSSYPIGIKKLIESENSHFIPYFSSDKLYFVENDLIKEMIMNGSNDTTFKVDYSIMLDTNYASYIDNFVTNTGWSTMNNEVFQSIDVLIRGGYHYDYLFYMIENYKNSFKLDEELDESIRMDKRAKLYKNLVSLELFKSIDQKQYIDNGTISYGISETEAFLLADRIFNGTFNANGIKEMMSLFKNLHQSMTLLLIGILIHKFENKVSVPKKIDKLFRFINDDLGIYYEREVVVAHQYFLNSKNVNMLNKINKGMNTEKLFRLIENIAWDFSVPRIMEYFLKLGGEGRFFIPFFLTNDFNLRQLLSLFKIKGVLFDKTGDLFVPLPVFNTNDYFKKHECNVEIYFTDDFKLDREAVYQRNVKEDFSIIKEKFKTLVHILK